MGELLEGMPRPPFPTVRGLMATKLSNGDKLRVRLVREPWRCLMWDEIALLIRNAVSVAGGGSPEGDKYLMEIFEYTKAKVEKRLIERMGPEPYKKRI